MQQIRGRVPDLMDKHGLSEDTLINNYLRPLLEAEETKFFAIRGKLESRNVKANGIRHAALNTAFMLHGSYAPRDPKEAAQFGVKVIVVDIPRPPRDAIDVEPSGNGNPPADNNGHD